MKLTTADCRTSEAYNIFNNLHEGIQNAIILDGSGRCIFEYNGTTRVTTEEKHRINNNICSNPPF